MIFRGRHIYYTTTLPEELVKRLKADARSRRVKQKELVIAALSDFYAPPDKNEDVLLRRLKKIEERQASADDKMEILSETIALFIQVWFSNTFELPENEKASASAQGERRFQRFVDALSRRLKSGQGFVTEQEGKPNGHEGGKFDVFSGI